jgi:hypothetical protein
MPHARGTSRYRLHSPATCPSRKRICHATCNRVVGVSSIAGFLCGSRGVQFGGYAVSAPVVWNDIPPVGIGVSAPGLLVRRVRRVRRVIICGQ